MLVRKFLEDKERRNLSPFAALSVDSRGRLHKEMPCPIRTDFQRDRDRIIHCKSFRRLKHKTQVFLSPVDDHFRTRLTHTLEVAQIARTLARALSLNEDLAEAISLGHDLGHTPFGHAGEAVLNDILKEHGMSFHHSIQSVRVIDHLEKNGKGLNLTWEVRDGIIHHSQNDPMYPYTLEGQIVRLADHIAYIRHDIEDAIAAKVIKKSQLPKGPFKILGKKILDVILLDIIKMSRGKNKIAMSRKIQKAIDTVYEFLYNKVYVNPTAKAEESKVPRIIKSLFDYYLEHPETLKGFRKGMKQKKLIILVADNIASMSDRYATNQYTKIFVPDEWHGNG
jgi:dGTPase